MPNPNHNERGAYRFPFLVLLALVAAIIYLAATFAPAYMSNQSMREAADEIIRRGAQQNLTDADIRAQLIEKIREFGLPAAHKIELRHEGKSLSAQINYKHRIRFPFYIYEWPVEILVRNVGF